MSKWILEGHVWVNGEIVTKPGAMLKAGSVVKCDDPVEKAPHDLTPADLPLDVAFEDEHLMVVVKPRGMASHPAPTLREPTLVNVLLAHRSALSQASGAFRPGIVHRLDKETTGLMLVAKSDAIHRALQIQIQKKIAERRYAAVVHGVPDNSHFQIDAAIGRDPVHRQRMRVDPAGRNALTEVKVLGVVGGLGVLACRLHTGRTHQIRVHLRSIGYPIVGDKVYGLRKDTDQTMALHAAYLAFTHPESGERIELFAAPPADFPGAQFITRGNLAF